MDASAETLEPGLFEAAVASPAGLFVLDGQGLVLAANPSGATLLGLSGAPVPPEALRHRLGPEAREALRVHLDEVFRTDAPQACELQLDADDRGPARRVLVQSTRLAGAAHCSATFVDVSARQAREDALTAALARAEDEASEKGTFLARFSHEVRSALASMVGFSELLRQNVDAKHHELADLIRSCGRHLLETLDAVMELSRLDALGGDVERVPVDVVSCVGARMAVLRPLARTRGLTIEWRPEADRAVARLNPMLLDRVVQNLVDNAVKYTPAGRVEVSVEAREGQVWIYVADTGVGIDAAFLPRLFTPFARERAGSGAPEGVGLGLAITRSLVERMGGQIFACSVKGEGTTFTVRFPLATPPKGEM